MAKPVSFSLSAYKTEFDHLYNANIKNTDPIQLQKIVERMTFLQEKIFTGLDRIPTDVSRYFNGPSSLRYKNVGHIGGGVEPLKIEIQEKLRFMIQLCKVMSSTSCANILTTSPLTLQTSNPSSPPPPMAADFASGFGNLGANCWANSLLSMILSMPNFKRAYETVANHYAQNNDNSLNQSHGQALLNALQAYDTALKMKQSVPASISQEIRLAFNHFFGRTDPVTFQEIFSRRSSCQEDALEALLVLMGHYEQIAHQDPSDPLPKPYSILQTKRHYRPISPPQPADPEKLLKNDYSTLTIDNISPFTNNDYQIILDLQNKGHLSFPALLFEYFRNTHIQGNDTGTYLLTNGQIQQFELIGEGRQFMKVPEELLLIVKRFGASLEGRGYKIAMPLAINQILVLPAESTCANAPIVYELDTFNVHHGAYGEGHYIAYRKIRGQWIEVDDATVRFVTDQEIDQILFGQKGATFTSYMHHYTLAAESRQVEVNGPAVVPATVSELEKLSLERLTCKQMIQQLETFNAILKTNADVSAALQDLERVASNAVNTLRNAIWLHDRTPDSYDYGGGILREYPKKLQEIKLPWLIGPIGTTLIEQMLIVQRRKLEIATEKCNEFHLRCFLEKVKSSSVSNEELSIALHALPKKVQNSLHGLVYHSHLKKFGKEYVHKEEYHGEYGKWAFETGDLRKIFTEATESVLNLWGKNILEQQIEAHRIKAEKLRYAYEKEQLQGLHDLIIRPSHEITPFQLFKAYERLEIRDEIREKLYWHIWYGRHSPQVFNYGFDTFKDNPRCVLGICEPNLARPPVCGTGSNILFQLIQLLEKESR